MSLMSSCSCSAFFFLSDYIYPHPIPIFLSPRRIQAHLLCLTSYSTITCVRPAFTSRPPFYHHVGIEAVSLSHARSFSLSFSVSLCLRLFLFLYTGKIKHPSASALFIICLITCTFWHHLNKCSVCKITATDLLSGCGNLVLIHQTSDKQHASVILSVSLSVLLHLTSRWLGVMLPDLCLQ